MTRGRGGRLRLIDRRQLAGIEPGMWGAERRRRGRKAQGSDARTERPIPRNAGKLFSELKADLSADGEHWWACWRVLRDLRPDLARAVLALKDGRAFA
jgi:hypothetical protein